MLIKIPDLIWKQFKYAAAMTDLAKDSEELEDSAAFMMVNALADYNHRILSARGPYAVESLGDEWVVVYREGNSTRIADGEKPRREKNNALRKAHKLNHKWNLAAIETE